MNAKLTLRLNADIIQRAKEYSEGVGKSVSRLVEDYFAAVTSKPHTVEELPPRVASLRGALAGSSVDEDDYRVHLEEKHG